MLRKLEAHFWSQAKPQSTKPSKGYVLQLARQFQALQQGLQAEYHEAQARAEQESHERAMDAAFGLHGQG